MYTVSQKRIPDIITCNMKQEYQILFILVQIFWTQPAIKDHSSFHVTKPLSLCYLNKPNKQNVHCNKQQKNVKKAYSSSNCFRLSSAISSQFAFWRARHCWKLQKRTMNPLIFGVQGLSTSSMLIRLKSSLLGLVVTGSIFMPSAAVFMVDLPTVVK